MGRHYEIMGEYDAHDSAEMLCCIANELHEINSNLRSIKREL